ncbi:hypothetical protein BJY16_003115 [Actinoplanes octamycinicus]|uniref:Uncharacterized protein n=1 Tax=Actinoplanes octamycinicus TaxID=135948 RepID=A0A7W7GWN9_9ACTN|nr:hypothetical protein [Actinoplanes octamycinicus]MBB4739656.1 hypothetical protein [Actinoplanes octamycinicus]GIE54839.1 hypothetical protein Aoc01nite_02410 [Actinoplanes octamycinicus]
MGEPTPSARSEHEAALRRALDHDALPAPPDQPWYGDREPSQLIDAGQWVLVAERYAAAGAHRTAMAALAEAQKFLVDEVLPDTAVWTPAGQRLRAEQPGRLTADGLRRAWAECDERLGTAFVDDPGETARRQARQRARAGADPERAVRQLSGLDQATGFSPHSPRAAMSAFHELLREIRQRFRDDPQERDRRLARVAGVRVDWDPDEDEWELPADRLPPADVAWEQVRAARTAAGQDPVTGEFVG